MNENTTCRAPVRSKHLRQRRRRSEHHRADPLIRRDRGGIVIEEADREEPQLGVLAHATLQLTAHDPGAHDHRRIVPAPRRRARRAANCSDARTSTSSPPIASRGAAGQAPADRSARGFRAASTRPARSPSRSRSREPSCSGAPRRGVPLCTLPRQRHEHRTGQRHTPPPSRCSLAPVRPRAGSRARSTVVSSGAGSSPSSRCGSAGSEPGSVSRRGSRSTEASGTALVEEIGVERNEVIGGEAAQVAPPLCDSANAARCGTPCDIRPPRAAPRRLAPERADNPGMLLAGLLTITWLALAVVVLRATAAARTSRAHHASLACDGVPRRPETLRGRTRKRSVANASDAHAPEGRLSCTARCNAPSAPHTTPSLTPGSPRSTGPFSPWTPRPSN